MRLKVGFRKPVTRSPATGLLRSILIATFGCSLLYIFQSTRIARKITTFSSTAADEPTIILSNNTRNVLFDSEDYQRALEKTLRLIPNVTTGSNMQNPIAGLNNQIIRFTGIILTARDENFGQVLESSFEWKDTHGTNEKISHHKLWDVVHWNSHYPTIPRFVSYDPEYHPHLAVEEKAIVIENQTYIHKTTNFNVSWNVWEKNQDIIQPKPLVRGGNQAWNTFRRLQKIIHFGRNRQQQKLNDQFPVYAKIYKGALRPHPFLGMLIEKERTKLKNGGKFMTLHARVESDMARQDRICTDKKVWNMTQIIDSIYQQFPEPPVNTVLIQFSRQPLQVEAAKVTSTTTDKYSLLAKQNLQDIDKLLETGMWGGTVKVVEAGSELVETAGDPFYKRYSTITGGIVNLFLAIESDIFIGTEVSSFSAQAVNSRFYRNEKENTFFYRPQGLVPAWENPHRFLC